MFRQLEACRATGRHSNPGRNYAPLDQIGNSGLSEATGIKPRDIEEVELSKCGEGPTPGNWVVWRRSSRQIV